MTYPANFPAPDHTAYSGTIGYGLLRTAVPAARPYQYKTFNTQINGFSLTFHMTNDLYKQWIQWADEFAYNWFNMDLVTPFQPDVSITSNQQVRFTTEVSYQKAGHNWLSVSVGAELYPHDVPYVQDRSNDDWVLGGTPAAPALEFYIGGTPAAPSTDWVIAELYQV